MLLGTLGASLLGNLLSGKGIVRAGTRNKKGKGIQKLALEKMEFLMQPHPLTNFEIKEYYKNEPRSNGVFSRDNLTKKKKKDGAYIINLDE